MIQIRLILISSFVLIVLLVIHKSNAGKKKGVQIIMTSSGLIYDEKKKKGDTIVIKDGWSGCGCKYFLCFTNLLHFYADYLVDQSVRVKNKSVNCSTCF